MSVLTFATFVAVVAAIGLMALPVQVWLQRGPVMGACTTLLQLAPAVATLAFLVLSYRYLRLPGIGYSRPDATQLFSAVALAQTLATLVGIRMLQASFKRKAPLLAISVLAALATVFVGAGAVACLHGDCF